MCKSKNDFPIAGYWGRLNQHSHCGQYDAMYKLINPDTTRPYTNTEVVDGLQQCKSAYPQLENAVDLWLKKVLPKAEQHPHAAFIISQRGKDSDDAKKLLERYHYKELESLAMLLFRSLYKNALQLGKVDVNSFVLYAEDILYADKSAKERKRLLGVLKNHILPVAGKALLNSLDDNGQQNVIKDMNKELSDGNAGDTLVGRVRNAYKGLLIAIESSGWKGCPVKQSILNRIGEVDKRNPRLPDSARPAHLDTHQRAALFKLLRQPQHLQDLFLVGLIYSGMAAEEITAAQFKEFRILKVGQEHCYTLLVTRRVVCKGGSRKVAAATEDAFPIQNFRQVVLYPWAGKILLAWVEQLRKQGFSDKKIREMFLFTGTSGKDKATDLRELKDRIRGLMKQAGIPDSHVIRTDKHGVASMKRLPADIDLLYRDAKHILEELGANRPMIHATLGKSWTETDENSYLDLLSVRYSAARYLRMRRFSPFPAVLVPQGEEYCLRGFSNRPTWHQLHISNPTNHTITLTLSADYGILASWYDSQKENNENEEQLGIPRVYMQAV